MKHIKVSVAFLICLFIGKEFFVNVLFEYNPFNIISLVAIVILSAIAPDADYVISIAGRLVALVLLLLSIYLIIVGNYLFAVIGLALLVITHLVSHKAFHSYFLGLLIGGSLWYFSNPIYGIGWVVGWFSHLVIDGKD